MPAPAEAPFDPVERAVVDIAAGRPVIVVDDEDRENEGDLVMAAARATPETINLMIRYGSGIVCVPMLGPQLDRLGLGPMVARNRESRRTDFAVSVDAAAGISTGVSAYDRALTIRLLGDPATHPDQLVQPGHVFPLRARPGGVLERAGHTEAAVDLALLAGQTPCGVICELVNEDGTMQRLPQLTEFRRKFGLRMISIAQLIAHRLRQDTLVQKVAEHPVSTAHGTFTGHLFLSRIDQQHHLALTLGDLAAPGPVLVRVQSADPLADLFRAGAPGAASPLSASLRAIAAEGRGAVLYLQPSQPGEALLRSLRLGSGGSGAAAMDLRDYGIGAQMLRALGLGQIRLLTRHPRRVVGLEAYGIELVEQVELP